MWRWLIAFALGLPTAMVISNLFPLRQSDQGQFIGWVAAMILGLGVVWLVASLVESFWERRRERRRLARGSHRR
jgi:uncharacterized membrane protein